MTAVVARKDIHKKYGTPLSLPVTYCSQLMTVAFGGTARHAALDGQIIGATKLEEIAARPANKSSGAQVARLRVLARGLAVPILRTPRFTC